MPERVHGQFFTEEQLSAHRSLTPEGFLLITDVPIARTGKQVYAANELPALEPSKDGLIIVERDPDQVFRPQTIASFNGKPFCDDHPYIGMLTPDSWREFARGTVLNPRRGDGLQFDNDFMFADILVTDAEAIKAIEAGKKEISAGYDAEYEQLEPGRARCLEIIGNHVALVDKGRCGPHCAIGDTDMTSKSSTRSKFLDRFRSAVSRGNTRDALEAVSEVAEVPELLGEIISDEMGTSGGLAGGEGGGENGKHHIEIHSHFNGMPGSSTKDDPAAATVAQPTAGGAAAGGGDVGAQLSALIQRVENIERVLMSLAEEEGGEEGNGDLGEKGASPMPKANGGGEEGDDDEGNESTDSIMEPEPEWRSTAGSEQGSGYEESKGAPSMPSKDRGTRDRRTAVGDSTSMREAFIATLSRAETLCPGIRLPTFDAARPAKDTFDAMCSFRRKTLDMAYKTEDARPAIDAMIEGRKPHFHDRAWTCDAIAMAFNGAAGLMAAKNQHSRVVSPRVMSGTNGSGARPPTPAELNAKNASFDGWHSR